MNPEIFAKELAKYGFELNEKQKKQFATYYDKLVEFNKKVNLTRITDKNEVYLKHFFDRSEERRGGKGCGGGGGGGR